MKTITPPSGFRDFLPQEAQKRQFLMQTIAEVYQSFGFQPLDTPAIEPLSLLMAKKAPQTQQQATADAPLGGSENESLIFKVLKRGEKLTQAAKTLELTDATSPREIEDAVSDLGLRFDLTLPLSRVVANHRQQLHFPWKVFHIGPVWRAERAQKGRLREFIQCDVDLVGAPGIGAELDVIVTVLSALQKVGAPAFELLLNDRRILEALARKIGFAEPQLGEFAVLLDKKDKMPEAELCASLETLLGAPLSDPHRALVFGALSLQALKSELCAEATLPQQQPQPVSLPGVESPLAQAFRELEQLIGNLGALNVAELQVTFDASLVRGMGYYTGIVFELRHPSALTSFGGGGRYDQLMSRFSNEKIPACGFSIGFERLMLLLDETREGFSPPPPLFLPVLDESLRTQVVQLGLELRAAGHHISVYPSAAKLKHQLKYASESAIHWMILLGGGDDHHYGLKNFRTGEQQSLTLPQLKAVLAASDRPQQKPVT